MTEERVTVDAFRAAMSCVASSVSVVTSDGPAGRAGMTVSSMCSVSDDPPSVLVCVNRNAQASEIIQTNGSLCVNVLHEDQDYVSVAFSDDYLDANVDLFVSGDWDRLQTGSPALIPALVNLDCRIEESLLFGTHYILVGVITSVRINASGQPLIYAGRRYRQLSPLSEDCRQTA